MRGKFGRKVVFAFAAMGAAFFSSAGSAQETLTPEMLASGDDAKGKRVFLRCRSCHTLEEGGRSLTGPNLWGVFGRQAGTFEGYRFSNALAEADFVWTPDKLNEWLLKPKDFLPGNKMNFVGLPKQQDRIDLIRYLQVETGAAASNAETAPDAADVPATEAPAADAPQESAPTP